MKQILRPLPFRPTILELLYIVAAIWLLFSAFGCGPAGRSTPLPAEGLQCWPEEIGETACASGALIRCDGERWAYVAPVCP